MRATCGPPLAALTGEESIAEPGGIESNCTRKGTKTNKTVLPFQGLIPADSLTGYRPSRHPAHTIMVITIDAEWSFTMGKHILEILRQKD